ncbi:MAG: transporter ATP-binding protein [Mycobacterium sp.]|jgi:branched-chain amino acid transport system ATP-binding protein|nr:transporter ATP-binding protein [Mycobacterium sp.]MCW2745387.1 transporter ATP-binding protein [Mycobacterium sp.]
MSIELRGVTAGYVKDVAVVRDIDVHVPTKAISTIIGPNGSGKSTLLRSVVGQTPHTSGSILVDGTEVTGVSAHRRTIEHKVAFVPQVANVFGPLTIVENLEVGGARLARKQRRQRITELLDTYPDLAAKRRVRAESLSGGQRQLLALARALMTSPTTLLLDEPSAGLSPAMMDSMFDAVRNTRDAHGVTVLLVEQNAVQSLEISDFGVVLVAGELAMHGPAQDILSDPSVGRLYLGLVG